MIQSGQSVVKVPAPVPDAQAATAGCAGGTVMAMLEKAGPLTDRRILVSGAGMLGIVAVSAARSLGATEITAVDPHETNRGLAFAAGADHACPPDDISVAVDVAFELSGSSSAVSTCLDSLDIGGMAVLAGSIKLLEVVDSWVFHTEGRSHVTTRARTSSEA